ncbi:MAG TPA: hypothetical protein VHI13_17875 [Candidatus Kapabacteria bacterium]|nr:hypothetical protein [Candidatus Kapabacteria bacterium]
MRLVDFTGERGDDVDYAAFRSHYERFWSSPDRSNVEMEPSALRSRLASLRSHLVDAERAFERLGLSTSGLGAVAFLGHGTSNGHACLLSGRFVAWYALEQYTTPHDFAAFVPHELAHAVHYALVPDFSFTSIEEQRCTGRQLVTEGLATRIAQRAGALSPEAALWGGYLEAGPAQAWTSRCRSRLRELVRFILDHWAESLPGNPLFTYNPAEDILKNTGGYYVGMAATAHLEDVEKLSLAELIAMPRLDAEQAYQRALLAMFAH